MGGDVEVFALAGPFAAIESLLRVIDGKCVFPHIRIHLAQDGVGHGEIGIELDGILEIGNRLRLHTAVARGLTEGKRLQTLQRRGGGLLDGYIVFLNGAE